MQSLDCVSCVLAVLSDEDKAVGRAESGSSIRQCVTVTSSTSNYYYPIQGWIQPGCHKLPHSITGGGVGYSLLMNNSQAKENVPQATGCYDQILQFHDIKHHF
jgi:hypothetical protein